MNTIWIFLKKLFARLSSKSKPRIQISPEKQAISEVANPEKEVVAFRDARVGGGVTAAGDSPRSFVVFDIETTGLHPNSDKIIELAAIKVIDGKPAKIFSSLIKFSGKLKPEIIKLTGIKAEDLKDAPDRRYVFERFRDFVGDLPLVGHNVADFDNKFLWFGFMSVGLEPLKNGLIDTLQISRRTFYSEKYSLTHLCAGLGIETKNAHRALDDAKMTLKLYTKIREKAVDTIEPKFVEYQDDRIFKAQVSSKHLIRIPGVTDHPEIAGKRFCITSFQAFNNFQSVVELQQFIVDRGGTVGGMTRKTDFLIDFDNSYESSKEAKARELVASGKSSVKIITASDFLAMLKH